MPIHGSRSASLGKCRMPLAPTGLSCRAQIVQAILESMAENSGGHPRALSVADEYRTFELQLKAMLQHAAMAHPHQPSPTIARTDRELRRAQASLKVTLSL